MSRFVQFDTVRWHTAALVRSFTRSSQAEATETLQPILPFESRTTRPPSRSPEAGPLVVAGVALTTAAVVVLLAAYDRGPFRSLYTATETGPPVQQSLGLNEMRRETLTQSLEAYLARRADDRRRLDTLVVAFGRQTSGFQTALERTIQEGSGLDAPDLTALREADTGVAEARARVRSSVVSQNFDEIRADAGLTNAEGVLVMLQARAVKSAKPLSDLADRLAGARGLYSDMLRVKHDAETEHAALLASVSGAQDVPVEHPKPAVMSAFGPTLPVWPVAIWFLAVGGVVAVSMTALQNRYLRTQFIRPLEQVRETLRDAESGNHTARVDLGGAGIVTEVQESLNDMLETIQLQVVPRVEHERTVSNLVESHEQITRRERLAAADELAAGVVADLDERVASAVGFAEMARRHMGSPKLEHDLGALIDQLTEVGRVMRRLTNAPARTEMPVVRLNALAAEVADIARQHVWPKVDVSLRVAAGDHIVKGDASRLRQAVLNLVSNARAAMPTGGQLWIEVGRLQSAGADGSSEMTAQPESLVLRVRDTGRGIPQAQLTRLFEPFDSTNAAAGAGLGLPQVAGIMAQHGGGVRVESQEGLGTTVSLLFPCAQEEQSRLDDEDTVEALALAS